MSPFPSTGVRTIYADLRCLQDLAFRDRGIGTHITCLLRGRAASEFHSAKVIGLLDPDLPELPAHLRALVDETTFCLSPITHPGSRDLYLQCSPMTHDIADTWAFRRERGVVSAAVVFDFIPYDWPGYLATTASRINYLASLARLRNYDCFFPISRYAAKRLRELTQRSEQRVFVTGAPVRESLVAAARILPYGGKSQAEGGTARPFALVVGGQDQRKNLSVAIEALRIVRQQGNALELKVVGNYTDDFKRDVLASCPGGWLSFSPDLTDEQLAALYSGAEVCIVPSLIEGFSLPVVEAAECGCPVLASVCAAHLELVDDRAALFQADEPGQLADRLRSLLNDPELRARIRSRQSNLTGQFLEQRVSERFWTGIARSLTADAEHRSSFSIARQRLPRLAFLSPYPPDQTGVARFSEHTLAAAGSRFEISLYTDAPGPLQLPPHVRHAGPLTPAPIVKGDHEAVLLVLGNSHFHNPILDIAERYGGPAILHDSRMIQIYYHRLGRMNFKALMEKSVHRQVTDAEIDQWLNDQDPPTLFFEPVLNRTTPLIVHSQLFRDLFQQQYGIEANVVPFPPNTYFRAEELAGRHRDELRSSLGLSPDSFVISTFGHVAFSKAPAMCIVAVELLRAWKIPAELYFVGAAGEFEAEIRRVARQFGIEDHVHFSAQYVDDKTYRDYLIASDAAVQLRTYAMGQLSAALADCASAGLPTIAPLSLIEACGAPGYCKGLEERYSPVQLADALAEVAAGSHALVRDNEARASYLRESNFGRYAARVAEVLGLA